MFATDPVRAGREAALSSLTTHANPVCQQSCHILASVIATALQGNTKADVIAACQYHGPGPCREELLPIIAHEFLDKERKQIRSDGWVVSTLEAALWAFARTDTFQDGAILAVNLAHDADTVGAVYGAIAGAFYGYEAIPLEWLEDLKAKIVIESVYVPFEARVLAEN
jgi:ADP-ribosylglycohydrolase